MVDAAREKGILAFGNVNDMNKEENGTDVVVTSALWDMGAAIDNAIAEVKVAAMTAEILAGKYVVEIIDDEPKSTY